MNIELAVGRGITVYRIEISCEYIENMQNATYIMGGPTSTDSEFILRLNTLESVTWDIDGGAWLDKCGLNEDEIALKLLHRNGELINVKDLQDGYPTACLICGSETHFCDESNPIGAYCSKCDKLFDEASKEIPQIKAR
jgi:hypothetical protein